MEKIKLGLKNIQGILSRSELKAIQGGSGSGLAQPCGKDGRGMGDACVTRDGQPGTCKRYMGIFGCVPN